MSKWYGLGIGLLVLAMVPVVLGQRDWGRRRGPATVEEHRRMYDFPEWETTPGFKKDTFTFARVKYSDSGWGNKWSIDFPDSDLNFSLRLQQLTSLKVNPNPVVVELSDEKIFNYPFLYMIEPGHIYLYPEEVKNLRRYCENGGFLMVDDFWGDNEYWVFKNQIEKVFPGREIVDLDVSHDIFSNVYQLNEMPQIPSIGWTRNGMTYEWRENDSGREVHYRAIHDDEGRMMVLICHNTDLGDGWEREGANRDYFEQFSVKKAYPMGINIVTYAMTH